MKLRTKEEIKYYYKLSEDIFKGIFDNDEFDTYIIDNVKFYKLHQIKRKLRHIKSEFKSSNNPNLEYIINRDAFRLADTIKENSLYNKDSNYKKMYESCFDYLNR